MTHRTSPVTLGVIVGNRRFFPDHLCDSGRATVLKVLAQEGIRAVALTPEETHFGSIESLSDAQKCADLFRRHAAEIDGVLVTLPNFGDERAVANALRWSGLEVPVLVHAFPDEVGKMDIANRRDSFCGKLSACNNLKQYGIKYTLTTLHTVDPESESFRADLRRFAATCRVVRGLHNVRVGVVGARPAAFNTVRFSEKLLERAGISVETIDLSEVFGRAWRLADDDPQVKAKLDQIVAPVGRHSRESGNPGRANWTPAFAGVTSWTRKGRTTCQSTPSGSISGRNRAARPSWTWRMAASWLKRCTSTPTA